jgi:hypothetical protein
MNKDLNFIEVNIEVICKYTCFISLCLQWQILGHGVGVQNVMFFVK